MFRSSLLDAIPSDYDELIVRLESEAETSEHPWAVWALATWSAVIADDLTTADRCAGHTVRRAEHFGVYPRTIAECLQHVVRVIGAQERLDHERLGRLALLIDPAAPSAAGAIVDTMDPMLEFAHWMVFADRPLDALRFIARARRPVGDALDPTRRFTADAADGELGLRRGHWEKVDRLMATAIEVHGDGAAYFRSLAARSAIIAGDFARAAEEIRLGRSGAGRCCLR